MMSDGPDNSWPVFCVSTYVAVVSVLPASRPGTGTSQLLLNQRF